VEEEAARIEKLKAVNPRKAAVVPPSSNNSKAAKISSVVNLFEQAKNLRSDAAKLLRRTPSNLA